MPAELNDSLADLLNGPMGDVRGAVNAPADYRPREWTEPCNKCGGSGRWRGRGRCFACNGVGKKTFNTSPEERASQRVARVERRAENARDIGASVEAFKATNPDIWNWIETSQDFAFAVSMREALYRYGDLTQNQLVACLKCVQGRQRAAETRQAREANAPAISITKIEEAFEAVASAGLKYPKLNLATFEFKPASERSKWHGSIYVTEQGQYLGRVTAGKFVCTSACTPEQQQQILEAAADPETAAIAYGKRTGTCACCRRELTDPESIELGIGPVCMKKWGW